jgi:hypothetical protein
MRALIANGYLGGSRAHGVSLLLRTGWLLRRGADGR